MRAGGGKSKGASFEREVCVALSKWISNGQREDVFWRSALSGGRATVGRRAGKSHDAQVGDISCIHPLGHRFISKFAPECKHYRDLNYNGLLTGKGHLLSFWSEITNQALAHGKLPFLVAKQNRMPAFVCLSADGKNQLGLLMRKAQLVHPPSGMYIFNFEDFLSECPAYVDDYRGSTPNRRRKRLINV